jgi:hypothetical protein
MWRLYDGLSQVTLEAIGDAIGYSATQGASWQQITNGVQLFTSTGAGAVWDFGPTS